MTLLVAVIDGDARHRALLAHPGRGRQGLGVPAHIGSRRVMAGTQTKGRVFVGGRRVCPLFLGRVFADGWQTMGRRNGKRAENGMLVDGGDGRNS